MAADAAGGFAGFARAEEPALVKEQAPPAIRVVGAAKRELVETLSVNGTIVAREEAAVGTDLNGLTVVALNADIGDTVRKGEVLAVLDRSMLDTQLAQMVASRAQAEANVAQLKAQIGDAEVTVRQAEEALTRALALQQKGIATDAQRDNAVNAVDSARAKLDFSQKGSCFQRSPARPWSTRRSRTCCCRFQRQSCARRPTDWFCRATPPWAVSS